MNEKNKETMKTIRQIVTEMGFKADGYGNRVKKYDDVIGRFKFNATSMRMERRVNETGSKWVRIVSAYYKDLSVVDGEVLLKGKVLIRK